MKSDGYYLHDSFATDQSTFLSLLKAKDKEISRLTAELHASKIQKSRAIQVPALCVSASTQGKSPPELALSDSDSTHQAVDIIDKGKQTCR